MKQTLLIRLALVLAALGLSGCSDGGPSLLPDLVVSSLTRSPEDPTVTEPITYAARVSNIGHEAAGGFAVGFTVGSEPDILRVQVGRVGVGGSVTAEVTSGPHLAGEHADMVTADVDNAVLESEEANNVLTVPGIVDPLINFERLPDGTPACTNCELTNQFESLGVVFSFVSAFTELTHAELVLTTNNPDRVPDTAVNSTNVVGIVSLAFAGAPQSVRFEERVNNSVPEVPVIAFDPSGGEIPAAQITRTDVLVYNPGTVDFRQEIVTITNANGISRVDIDGRGPGPGGAGGFGFLIDDLLITR